MRILLINYEYPPLGGGAAKATANIAREMAALGHTVLVMTSRWRNLPHEETVDGYTVIRIPARRAKADRSNPIEMLSFLFSSVLCVLKLRRRWPVDYTLAFFGIPSGPAAWVLKKVAQVPYIISLRGGDVPGIGIEGVGKYEVLSKPVIQFLWKRAAHVVANSQSLAELARRSSRGKDIPVIPNGVDTTFFCPGSTRRAGQWVFVGRITAYKGVDYLIEAVSQLTPEEQQKLNFCIVGDGLYRLDCIRLAQERGVSDRFEFVGWKSPEQIRDYYQASEGFIFPTLFEGMPNALLEAMACGLPVISTTAPGIEGLVQDNGWVVTPANADELAERLRYALLHPTELSAMGQRSRELAQTYSWRTVAERYLDLMQSP